MDLNSLTRAELIREIDRLRSRLDALIAERKGPYSHLTGRDRQEAIRESNQRAGGNYYGG